jgi:stringent starvation protein B
MSRVREATGEIDMIILFFEALIKGVVDHCKIPDQSVRDPHARETMHGTAFSYDPNRLLAWLEVECKRISRADEMRFEVVFCMWTLMRMKRPST